MLKEKEKAYLHFQIVLQFFLPNKRKKIIPQLYSSNFKLNYFLHFEPGGSQIVVQTQIE